MFRKLIFVLVVALVIGGCAPAPTPAPTAAPLTALPAAPTVAPTAAPTATATLAPLVKVNSAYSMVNPDPAPVWIAMDNEMFKKNGLDVSLIFLDGGTRHAQALIAKEISIGFTSGAPMISAAAAGQDTVIIAGIVNRPNYDFVVRPEIKSGADLKGKKVAVSGLSGSSYTAMRIALKELFKLDPDKDVTYLSIGNETQREAALVSKQIDATILNPDSSIQAKKDGLVVLESLWDKPIAYQHTAIGTTKTFIKENPQAVTNYIKTVIQAIGFIKDPANKAKVIASIGKWQKTEDKDVLESAYARITGSILQCAPYATLDGVKVVIGETEQAVQKGLTAEQVVDNSFIKSLEDSGFVKANCK